MKFKPTDLCMDAVDGRVPSSLQEPWLDQAATERVMRETEGVHL